MVNAAKDDSMEEMDIRGVVSSKKMNSLGRFEDGV
jgi:hypothetical protein